jgi:type IV pilus assembly protein PilX
MQVKIFKNGIRGRKSGSPFPRLLRRDERGMALILTLVMLTLMSLLGALALSTSDSELGISSNYRSSQEAFYAAERGLEYATMSQAIYSQPLSNFPVSLTNNDPSVDTTAEANIAVGTGNSRSGLRDGAVNQVNYVGSGPLPPGSGSDPTYFQSRFYAIDITGQGPSNSAVRLQAQVARIVPK